MLSSKTPIWPFQVTEKAEAGGCDVCGRVQCGKCGLEVHDQMPCDEYRKIRDDADQSILKWMGFVYALCGEFWKGQACE